jgi:Tfp pilus assembly protein PilN
MPQQINLCSPLTVAQKQSFSAQTMAQALGVFVVVGGMLCGAWVWNLKKTSADFSQTLESQSRDIQNLKSALVTARADATPIGPAMQAQLQTKRTELAGREQLREAMKEGLSSPGRGHSDRLAMVASSIPQPAWITGVKADSNHFEVSGFTLEPSALNAWVARLTASPLLSGLKLATVQVENATAPGAAAPRQIWSFNLVSETAPRLPAPTAGVKP